MIYKHIKVLPETHSLAKSLSREAGQTLQAWMHRVVTSHTKEQEQKQQKENE